MTQHRFNLRNIILMTLISILCGVIFYSISFLEDGIQALLMPFGLSIMANDVTQGPWILTAPLVGFLFRFPGSSFFGQFVSSIVEMFMGDQGGWTDVLSGVFDGVGYEAGFFCTGYRHYNQFTLALASLLTTVSTFVYSWFMNGYYKLPFGLLSACFGVRFVSILVFSEVAYVVVRMIRRAVPEGTFK